MTLLALIGVSLLTLSLGSPEAITLPSTAASWAPLSRFEEEEQQQLAAAFATESVAEVRVLMIAYPDRIVINRARGAVQVYDCSGRVGLQVGLDDERLEALTLD